jgi:hypothetical protein
VWRPCSPGTTAALAASGADRHDVTWDDVPWVAILDVQGGPTAGGGGRGDGHYAAETGGGVFTLTLRNDDGRSGGGGRGGRGGSRVGDGDGGGSQGSDDGGGSGGGSSGRAAAATTYNREDSQLAPRHIGCIFGTTRAAVSRRGPSRTIDPGRTTLNPKPLVLNP